MSESANSSMNRQVTERRETTHPNGNSIQACHTMIDVRREIDRVDRLIVRLLAERQGYIEAAAIIKSDRGTVRDPARIEDVVAKVLSEARSAGLSLDIAEPVWRTLIQKCIEHEFNKFDERA